jgi:hypothetical protein
MSNPQPNLLTKSSTDMAATPPSVATPPKRPYVSPKLVEYDQLADLIADFSSRSDLGPNYRAEILGKLLTLRNSDQPREFYNRPK